MPLSESLRTNVVNPKHLLDKSRGSSSSSFAGPLGSSTHPRLTLNSTNSNGLQLAYDAQTLGLNLVTLADGGRAGAMSPQMLTDLTNLVNWHNPAQSPFQFRPTFNSSTNQLNLADFDVDNRGHVRNVVARALDLGVLRYSHPGYTARDFSPSLQPGNVLRVPRIQVDSLGHVENIINTDLPLPSSSLTGTSGNGLTVTSNSVSLALASTTVAGAMPARTGAAGTYLNVDGTWQTPPNTTNLVGTSGNGLTVTSNTVSMALASGVTAGTVPNLPPTNQIFHLLRGDNSWQQSAELNVGQGLEFNTPGGYSAFLARTISHSNSGVAAGTYGSQTTVPQFTVNAMGHITSVTNQTITGLLPSGTQWQALQHNGSNWFATNTMYLTANLGGSGGGVLTVQNTGGVSGTAAQFQGNAQSSHAVVDVLGVTSSPGTGVLTRFTSTGFRADNSAGGMSTGFLSFAVENGFTASGSTTGYYSIHNTSSVGTVGFRSSNANTAFLSDITGGTAPQFGLSVIQANTGVNLQSCTTGISMTTSINTAMNIVSTTGIQVNASNQALIATGSTNSLASISSTKVNGGTNLRLERSGSNSDYISMEFVNTPFDFSTPAIMGYIRIRVNGVNYRLACHQDF